mmetsp:Transcript_19795/g.39846  ORF Transcript_19795/g.39846 Transcript_19795/m.39846 type:complete len:158 (+) Transcript_19795:1119-1592(+)
MTPLFTAASPSGEILSGDIGRDIAQLLFVRGANVNVRNCYGQTALHLAAWRGSLGVFEFLLENGADVHATDNDGLNALHWVAGVSDTAEAERDLFEKKLRIVQLLISKGVDVHGVSNSGRRCSRRAAGRLASACIPSGSGRRFAIWFGDLKYLEDLS